jgi:hypothetical protein
MRKKIKDCVIIIIIFILSNIILNTHRIVEEKKEGLTNMEMLRRERSVVNISASVRNSFYCILHNITNILLFSIVCSCKENQLIFNE